jgi:hypothetical protein
MTPAHLMAALVATLALVVAACGPETLSLPTEERTAEQLSCAGIGLDATLAGDASDPRRAWLVQAGSGDRIDVVWPAGYRARFAPAIEVVDAGGNVVMTEGDQVTTACVIGGDPEAPLLIVD